MKSEIHSTERTPTVSKVLEGIRDEIFMLELKNGEMVTENFLAEKHQVSRGSIRSALLILENEGLISTLPNGRKVIVGINEKSIEDLYETRVLLEQKAALICLSTPNIDCSHLATAISRFYTLQSGDQEDITLRRALANTGFHRALFETAGNSSLLQCWETLEPMLHALVKLNCATLGDRNDDAYSVKSHTLLLEMIIGKKAETIDELVNHIMVAVGESLDGYRQRLKLTQNKSKPRKAKALAK